MADKRFNDLRQLSSRWREKTPDSYATRKMDEAVRRIVQPGFIGIDFGTRDVYQHVNSKLFITEFAESDIDYFYKALDEIPRTSPGNEIQINLGYALEKWSWDNDDASPYEAFLWALKLHDGYLGSIKWGSEPDTRVITQIVEAMASIWKEDDPVYLETLRNVLAHWTWYQPVHVALRLYGSIAQMGGYDEEIEKYISNTWLYRSMYSRSAFESLCKMPPTQEHIRTIMDYIKYDEIDDDMGGGTKIVITNPNREKVARYLSSLDAEFKEYAETYYRDAQVNCSRKARQIFQKVFEIETPPSQIDGIVRDWKTASEDERQRLLSQFRISFTADKNQLSILSKLPKGELFDSALQIIDNQNDPWQMQYCYLAMIESNREEYRQYIISKAQKLNEDGIHNDEWFLAACAWCLLGKTDILGVLCRELYVNGVALQKSQAIMGRIRIRYSDQFSEGINEILKEALASPDMASRILINCSRLYKRNKTLYPISFDKLANMLLSISKDSRVLASKYSQTVLELIEAVSTVSSRTRYYNMLIEISGSSVLPPTSNLRKRADDRLSMLYPPQ